MKQASLKLAFTAAAFAMVLGLAFAPVLAGGHEGQGAKAALPDGQARAVIPVSGMHCSACAATIKTAVKKLDGVVNVEVNNAEGHADVTYVKDKVTVAKIVETINKTGFKATEPKTGKDS